MILLSSEYITASDIKNYIYCPRIVYFSKVMNLEPLLYSQQKDILLHEEEEEKIGRRDHPLPNIKADNIWYNLRLRSEVLQASGVIDCVIEVNNRLIPIEFKAMKSKNGKAYSDHKYQLTLYSILLDTIKPVNEGYIHYILDEKIVRVVITHTMKQYVKRLLSNIRDMIDKERIPPITVSKKKCMGGCGYRRICYGY